MSKDSTSGTQTLSGHDLAPSFFKDTGTSGTDFKKDSEFDSTVFESEKTNEPKLLEPKALEEIESLKNKLEEVEKMIKVIFKESFNSNRLNESTYPIIDQYLDETEIITPEQYKTWLDEWRKEEPEIFLNPKEVEKTILEYERKYKFTSNELLQRIEDGTAPDNYDIADWLTLLESLP